MDGVALAEAIRQISPRTIVVMLTAYKTSVVRERITHATVQYVLDKPVQLSHIREVTLNALTQLP
jgi:CheY-like chemotaxis protein